MNSRGSSRHFAPMSPAHLRHIGMPPQLMRHCTAADCDPIRGDSLDEQLPWNGKPGWPEVAQSEFYPKLRFHIAPGMKLYSLTIDPPEVKVWQVKLKTRLD